MCSKGSILSPLKDMWMKHNNPELKAKSRLFVSLEFALCTWGETVSILYLEVEDTPFSSWVCFQCWKSSNKPASGFLFPRVSLPIDIFFPSALSPLSSLLCFIFSLLRTSLFFLPFREGCKCVLHTCALLPDALGLCRLEEAPVVLKPSVHYVQLFFSRVSGCCTKRVCVCVSCLLISLESSSQSRISRKKGSARWMKMWSFLNKNSHFSD